MVNPLAQGAPRPFVAKPSTNVPFVDPPKRNSEANLRCRPWVVDFDMSATCPVRSQSRTWLAVYRKCAEPGLRSGVTSVSWDQRFDDPIVLPGRRATCCAGLCNLSLVSVLREATEPTSTAKPSGARFAAGERHSLHNLGGDDMLVLTIYDPPRERPRSGVSQRS